MSDHTGHRKRMKKRFLEHGAEGLEDHNLLEILLYFALPRVDTNLLAHDLLEYFGSLDAVMEATPEELMAVEGIGESAATLIKLIPAIGQRYLTSKYSVGTVLSNTEDAGRFLLPRFLGRRDETVMVVCLDSKMKALSCRAVASGDVSMAHVSVRKVVEQALSQNATFVVLAHNHVNGLALPSTEDVATTHHMKDALALVGVTLLDHIIVAGDDYVSLRDNGVLEAPR